jgi:hypothetical protein
MVTVKYAFVETPSGLVRLRAPEHDDGPFVHQLDIVHPQGGQFAHPVAPGEAEQQRPVPRRRQPALSLED